MESFPSSHNPDKRPPAHIDVEELPIEEEIEMGVGVEEATPEQIRETLDALNAQIAKLQAVFATGAEQEGKQTEGLAVIKTEIQNLLEKRAALEEHLKQLMH